MLCKDKLTQAVHDVPTLSQSLNQSKGMHACCSITIMQPAAVRNADARRPCAPCAGALLLLLLKMGFSIQKHSTAAAHGRLSKGGTQ